MDSVLTLASPAFEDGGVIPARYTCDGGRTLSPPLAITGVPEGAKSLVLLMDDPDIPEVFKKARGIEAFDHWVVYNIPADTKEISEGATVGVEGLNSAGKTGYIGPCPPPEYEPSEHRYVFALYALSDSLSFDKTPTKQEALSALAPLRIAEAKLVGRYSRT